MILINKTGKHLGAEILGVDLSRPLDDGAFARISDAFFEHQVVVFRGQKLTPSQQIAFTRRFGELEHHVRKEHRLDGYPEILVVSNVVDQRGACKACVTCTVTATIAPRTSGPRRTSRPAARAWCTSIR